MSVEPTVPAEQALSALAEQFAHWRQTRSRPHEPIPAALWAQAITLSEVLPESRVAKRLRLSQTDLKKRRRAQSAASRSALPTPSPSFIEISASLGTPVASEALLVEFERPDGARMRLRYRQSPPLRALIQSFLEPS